MCESSDQRLGSEALTCPWCEKAFDDVRLMYWEGSTELDKRCGHCDKPIKFKAHTKFSVEKRPE